MFVAAGNQGVDVDRSPVYPASYDLPGGVYAYWSGTSMATPFVSGAAALILGNCPVGANEVRPLLLETADRVAAGMRLNLARALSRWHAPPAQSDGPPVDDGAWPTVPSRPR